VVAIGVLGLTLLAAACTSHGRSVESDALVPLDAGDLHDTKWILVATGDSDAVGRRAPLYLAIAADSASGTGPCNRFRLPFRVDGNDVTTGAVATTNKHCGNRVDATEARYFRDLERVDTAEKQFGRLVLTGPHDTRLVFERARVADQLEGTWDIVAVAGDDAITGVLRGTEATLDFDRNGTVAIATGCNTGSAAWEADGHALTITAARTTRKACREPEGLTAQEAAILSGLERVAEVEAVHDSAMLLADDGTIVFVLARDS
jgi:heat shock protein HslJ